MSLGALEGWFRLAKRMSADADPWGAMATPLLPLGFVTHCRTRFVMFHCTTCTRPPSSACTLADDSEVVEMGGALRPVTVSPVQGPRIGKTEAVGLDPRPRETITNMARWIGVPVGSTARRLNSTKATRPWPASNFLLSPCGFRETPG
jgi:hypothetical protein